MNINLDEAVKILRDAKNMYYNTGDLLISDDEYSTLEDLVRSIDPNHEVLSETGAPVIARKIKHEIPMGSLSKAQISEPSEMKELKDKIFKYETVQSEKMDGCSCELIYIKGNLDKAITRGDGVEGSLIISPELIDGIPSKISNTNKTVIRGEVFFYEDKFKSLNTKLSETGSKTFVNARNAVSGILNRDDSTDKEYMSFRAFDIITETQFETKIQKFEALIDLGFETPKFKIVTWDEFIDNITVLNETRKTLPYLIDGMVVDINNVDEFEAQGVTENKPKGAMALKFDPISASTVITNIVWQVGSTGCLTPVLEFEPVFVDGSTIARASIHNYTVFKSLNLGDSDIISVHKANDIIPQLKNVIKSVGEKFVEPTNCPVCGSHLVFETKGITNIVCKNVNCDAQKEGIVSKWIAKSGMSSKGIGDSFIKTFTSKYNVTDIYDITIDDIKNLSSSYKDKSATKIYEAIQSSKEMKLEDFFGGLNGKGAGTKSFKKIIDYYKFETIDDVVNNISGYTLVDVDGIDIITANNILNTIINAKQTIDILKTKVVIKKKQEVLATFVFTGSFNTINPITGKNYKRDDLKKMAETKGFGTEDSVKKGVTYLVQSDLNSVSSKSEKAKKLNITIISEDDFFNMM